MSETTSIEWCDKTWSPWEGCQKVSPACDFCYAEARNNRFSAGRNWGPGAPRRKTADWMKPRLWNRKAAKDGTRPTVFPSICDPFDNAVPDEWREEFFELIRVTPHLTWLLLTKRPQNIAKMVRESGIPVGALRQLPLNAWLGTTAEDQKRANHNVIHLLRAKKALGARIAFLSVEPMLEEIRLWKLTEGDYQEDPIGAEVYPLCGLYAVPDCDWAAPKLDWVIAGGESGAHARPTHPEWFRSLRDQCARDKVPFLFKQWGEWGPCEHVAPGKVAPVTWVPLDGSGPTETNALSGDSDYGMSRFGKKVAGRLLDGVEHNGFPAVPA